MRVDGPSRALVGFSNYTQKIAADAVDPDKLAASEMSNASQNFKVRADSPTTESALKSRSDFSTGVAQGRADSIEYSRQADANNRSADKAKDALAEYAYSKGSIIDTVA